MVNMMLLGGEAFGRSLGREGRTLVNGSSVLMKEAPERALTTSTVGGPSEKQAVRNPEEVLHQNPTMLTPLSWTSCLQNCGK